MLSRLQSDKKTICLGQFGWVLLILIGLISCKNKSTQLNFYKQDTPNNIPMVYEPGFISIKGRLEQGFSISPDYSEIHFGVIGNHDSLNCIYVTVNKINGWTSPEKPGYIGNDSVFFPMYAPDGKTLTFTKRHPNSMQTDLWYCKKNNNKWSDSKRFSDKINSVYREGSSCLSLDNTLYFTTNRDTAFGCCGDIYYSELKDFLYNEAKIVENVNSNFDEEGVFISPNKDYLIIQSWKTEYTTKHDLYISYKKKDGSWTKALRLDTLINSVDLEQRPFVTYDNSYLFFNRFKLDSLYQPVESDIYWVSTQNIFKPFVYNPITEVTIRIGENTDILVPQDYFKDIDDMELDYSFDLNELTWLQFDKDKLTITGIPNQIGEYKLRITAVDNNANAINDMIKIIVTK